MDEPNVIPLNGISTLNGYSISKCDVISHHKNVLFQELTTFLCVNDTNNNSNVFYEYTVSKQYDDLCAGSKRGRNTERKHPVCCPSFSG